MSLRFPRFLSCAACLAAAVLSLSASAGVEPRNYYGKVAQRLADRLQRQHVLQTPLSDEISRRAWTNLVTFYDFDHSVFLQSDLDRLAARETTLDDEIGRGDVRFGYEVYSLYVTRLRERVDFATNLLKRTEWDFSADETYRIRRKDAPWPATRADAEEHWRKRLKNEVLLMKVNHDLDRSTNRLDAVGDIVKRYRQYVTVLTEPDEEAVLQHYLSALSRAYDPHSDYMSPTSKEDFDMEMNLTLCGVGAVLSMDDGALKIVEVMPGGPMDVDGRIREGDKIVGVQQEDGAMEDIMWQPMKKSIKKIRGKKGTKVTLEIVPRADPSGATKKRIELVRDEIKLEDQAATGHVERVSFNGVTRKLGYVKLPGFYGTMDKRPNDEGFRSCAVDVSKYLADFNASGAEGLVLDLRGNGGGPPRGGPAVGAVRAGRARRPDPRSSPGRLPADPAGEPDRLPQADGGPDGPGQRLRLGNRRRASQGYGACNRGWRQPHSWQGYGADSHGARPRQVRLLQGHDRSLLPHRRTFDAGRGRGV